MVGKLCYNICTIFSPFGLLLFNKNFIIVNFWRTCGKKKFNYKIFHCENVWFKMSPEKNFKKSYKIIISILHKTLGKKGSMN